MYQTQNKWVLSCLLSIAYYIFKQQCSAYSWSKPFAKLLRRQLERMKIISFIILASVCVIQVLASLGGKDLFAKCSLTINGEIHEFEKFECVDNGSWDLLCPEVSHGIINNDSKKIKGLIFSSASWSLLTCFKETHFFYYRWPSQPVGVQGVDWGCWRLGEGGTAAVLAMEAEAGTSHTWTRPLKKHFETSPFK